MLVFLCLGIGISTVSRTASAEVVDRIVAVVNDDIILLSDMNRALRPYAEKVSTAGYAPEQEEQVLFKVRTDLLNQMVDQKLTDQEAKRLNIIVTDKEIDNAVERIKEANYFTDEALRQMLARQGLTIDDYRQELSEQAIRTRLVNREVKSKIVITKEEMEAYYTANPDKYGGDVQYHLRNLMIQVPVNSPESNKRQAKARMDAIHAKLKAGQPHDTTGTVGMDLGVIGFQTLSPQLQAALKDLKPGQFTEVLDTDQGYQIFFVQDIKKGAVKPQEDVFEEIERELYEAVVNEKFSSWLEDLRKRSHIKIVQ